jgi:hypothetical protein
VSRLTQLPLPSGTFQLPEAPASNTALVNVMAQIPTSESGQKFVLVPTPGLVQQAAGGGGPVRAMVVRRDTSVIFESGGSLFVGGGGSVGSGLPTGTDLSMATDGITVLTCTNGRCWATTGGSTTEITSSMPFAPGAVCFLNGYFVVSVFQSNVFFISGLNAITWDPLDFATCEGGSTSIYGCLSIHLDVWFFTHDTIEVWYLSGAADFPFQRQLGGFLEVGVQGAKSHVKCDNTVYWLGNDRKVYKADGYAPLKVSDAGLDRWMFDRTMEDAVGISITLNGQICYVLTFPTENKTWVLSTLTGQWFNMSTNSTSARWRGNCSAFVNGLCLVGDALAGDIMAFDPNVFSESGIPIQRLVQFQPIFGGTKRAFMARFMLDCYFAVSSDSILLQWGDETGGSFNTGRHLLGSAAPTARMFVTRLGSFRRRLFLMTFVPAGDFAIMDAWAEITPSIEGPKSDGG